MSRTLRLILVLGAGALLAFLAAPSRADGPAAPPARTVILVRHAEKQSAPADPRNPPLSEAGAARARDLARLAGAAGATQLLASEYERTQATLAPLAARLDLDVRALPAADPAATLAALDALAPGSLAVVCGHSNTLPRLAALLGVELRGLAKERGQELLPDDAYDRLYVITRAASGPASCVELRYGAESGAAAGASSSSGK